MRHEQNSLTIYLLGPPRIEREGKTVDADTRKAIALLAYLALHNEHFSRDRLATLFWPEYDQTRAYANLRRTLWSLNKAIGEEWLDADHETIGLAMRAGRWIDVAAFQQWLAHCRTHGHPLPEICAACLEPLTQAADLVRGPFLDGFSLRDSPEFDDWQVLQTENLRQEFAGVLERLVAGYNAAGEFKRALEYARRWVALDPLHEPAQRQLMLTYAWAGQPADALQQYRKCERLLDEEMGVPPEKATTQLFETIRTRRAPPPVLRADLQQQVHLVAEPSAPASVPAPPPTVPAPPPTVPPEITQPETVLLPTATVVNNLPAQPTSFVGRNAEIAEIVRLLVEETECRLLTLLGPGGIGKTRLSLQAAQRILEFSGSPVRAIAEPKFVNGVCFVALAGIDAAELLATTVASALSLPVSGGQDPKTRLFDYLREKQLLLVLDNFEQLVEGADFLASLLEAAPDVKMIVTSRQRLNLSEEWLLVVPGLSLPQDDLPQTPDGYSAVQLFAERARRVRRTFALATEQEQVVRICQLLGGIPLGIELAAAWTRSLTCAEIAQEIQHNVDFLATTLRDVPERQRSLRAVFEQSWQMLAPAEQQVFQALSVFRGGFERVAAESVAGATLPLLRALGDKSFLQRAEEPAGRYAIHEGLRQFAAEKLGQAPAIELRHARYYAAFLEQRYTELMNGEERTIREIGREIDNIRIGWEWAVAQADAAILGQALKSLTSYYELRGWFREGEQLFGHAAQMLVAPARPNEIVQLILAQLYERQGWFKSCLGENSAARTLLQESLATFRQLEADLDIAYALVHVGGIQVTLGEYSLAEQSFQESVQLFHALGNLSGQAVALRQLGGILSALGRDAEAIDHFHASIALLKKLNNRRELAKTLKELGDFHHGSGHYPEARSLYQESRAIFQGIGELAGTVNSLLAMGFVALRMGNLAEAERFNTETLALATQLGRQSWVANALNNLGEVARRRGDLAQAREYFTQALSIHQIIDYREGAAISRYYLGCVADMLDEPQAKYDFAEALQIARDMQWTGLILFFCPGLATYLARCGQQELALEILALTLHDPAVDRYAKSCAQTVLSEIASTLAPEIVTAAIARGQRRDVFATAAELLEKLLK